MKISELQARQGKVDIEVDIVDKGEVREFEKFGRAGRVCNCTAKDESGEIKLTLWNEDIDKVNVGDKVKIENGYVGEWQGELQLSTGKFGKLEVVGKQESQELSSEQAEPEAKPGASPETAERSAADEQAPSESEDTGTTAPEQPKPGISVEPDKKKEAEEAENISEEPVGEEEQIE
ncbi:hypothetical protein GF351_06370 [Candidatus Woesearchaeota archaeon]|nr:hypothetical protein [Candidatus Woesearchaeota archaeon]